MAERYPRRFERCAACAEAEADAEARGGVGPARAPGPGRCECAFVDTVVEARTLRISEVRTPWRPRLAAFAEGPALHLSREAHPEAGPGAPRRPLRPEAEGRRLRATVALVDRASCDLASAQRAERLAALAPPARVPASSPPSSSGPPPPPPPPPPRHPVPPLTSSSPPSARAAPRSSPELGPAHSRLA
eukprot:tig00021491_g21769.t1